MADSMEHQSLDNKNNADPLWFRLEGVSTTKKGKNMATTFISKKYSSLTVVLDPVSVRKENGRVIIAGLNGYFPQGRRAEFVDGQYVTSDKKEIELLKAHKNYGAQFFAMEEEVVKPKPEALAEELKQKQFKAKIEAEKKKNENLKDKS